MDAITIEVFDRDYISEPDPVANVRPMRFSAIRKRPGLYAPRSSTARRRATSRTRTSPSTS